jgi:hypothetical protein
MTRPADARFSLGILPSCVLLSLPLFAVSFLAAGYGHGTLIPLVILHPWAALAGHVSDTGESALFVGLLELPVYGFVLHTAKQHWKLPNAVVLLAILHAVAIALAAKAVW